MSMKVIKQADIGMMNIVLAEQYDKGYSYVVRILTDDQQIHTATFEHRGNAIKSFELAVKAVEMSEATHKKFAKEI
jgi:hypothetical protein